MVSTEIVIGKLTFKIIDYFQLTQYHHYIIRTDSIHSCYVSGRFLERTFIKHPPFIQTREDGSGYFQPSGARFFIRDIFGEHRGLRSFNQRDYFYELVPKKHLAQQAMEKRALQIILRNLIGDNYFKYE